ncbi:MAG: TRAP transporter substrate-binding protein DctP [Dehalobacterium sp.]
MRKIWYLFLVAVLISGLALCGCGGQKAAIDDQVNNNPESTAPTTSSNAPEFTWKMQVIHSQGQSDFKLNQQTAEEILRATNGRLKIEIVPNGTLASSMEAFQACGDGVFEMHSSWPSYLKGVEYAFMPLTTGTMGMDAHDKWTWIYEDDGWDLYQKAFDKVNLKLLAVEIWGSEVMMANKPFNSVQEMKGSKFRSGDPRVLPANGVAGMTLPLEEVFTAMSQGTVDAAEFGHLAYDQGLGLTDIAKYGIFPDFWNVNSVTTVVVNKEAWNKLSPDLQLIVELAFKARELQHWTRDQYESAMVMDELQKSGKMEFIRMDPESFIPLRQQMNQIEQEEIQKYDGLTKEVYESQHKFMDKWYPYKDISRWWGDGLTVDQQLGK